MLTVDTGNEQALMRGRIRWQPSIPKDRDVPSIFSVSRSGDGVRLVMSNGLEGSIQDVTSNIVSTFMGQAR
jgi:hypothetical protein